MLPVSTLFHGTSCTDGFVRLGNESSSVSQTRLGEGRSEILTSLSSDCVPGSNESSNGSPGTAVLGLALTSGTEAPE